MSHFSLLVVTNTDRYEELEEALWPYHEFETTGEERYIQDVDQTAALLAEYDDGAAVDGESFEQYVLNYYRYPALQPDEAPANEHKYRYALLDASGHVTRVVDRTNPNAKWDWWNVGGRYRDTLITNNGPCDHAWFSALNVAAMRKTALDKRKAHVREARNALASGHDEGTVKLMYGSRIFDADYAANDRAWTFAVLMNGEWHERGQVGWFGVVSNEQSPEDWNGTYWRLLQSVKPRQYVWIVDCHI